MKHHALNANICLPILLLLSAGSVPADDLAANQQQVPGGAPEPAYIYSDDWGLVSAPPPQGPYNAINLDPRLPGQDLVAPMPMPDIGSPEAPLTGTAEFEPERPASVSRGTSTPMQSTAPPQTPYDYQPQPAPHGQPAQMQDTRGQHAATQGQPGPDYTRSPDRQAYGPAGFRNAPYPGAGRTANRPPVAIEQQQRRENQPPPGYYRPRDYSQPATRPMYGYPWSSRHQYSEYPAAGYSQPWQGRDPRASEVEVPPPSVYDRMMAEPPPARYAPPPGMMEYYGGGR